MSSTVETGEAAEFATMTPHAFTAIDAPAELIMVFDRDGQHAHVHRDADEDAMTSRGGWLPGRERREARTRRRSPPPVQPLLCVRVELAVAAPP